MRNWHGNLSPFGTFHTGSASALAIYAVLGIRPGLVLDFDGSFFWSSGRKSFSDVITHAATTNATMVDSDGLLKWAPHNLLTYSEDFGNAAWTKTNITVTANAATAPDGTLTADKVVATSSNGHLNQSFTAPAVANTAQIFSLVDGSAGTAAAGSWDAVETTDDGDGWWTFRLTKGEITYALSAKSAGWDYVMIQTLSGPNIYVYPAETSSSTGTADSTSGIYIWGAHLYRSDLGGMAPVPPDARVAGSTTYVPTTSTAKYLPRRHNHTYNGSAWVDAGYLHESKARTNLITYSNDFTDASWTKFKAAVVAGQGVSPDGSTNAVRLTENGDAGNEHYLSVQASKAASAITYSASVFIKRGSSGTRNIGVGITDGTTGGYYSVFDPDDGSIVAEDQGIGITIGWTPVATFSETVGDYYRVTFVAETNTVTRVDLVVYMLDGTTRSYDGDGTSNNLIYGAQLEEGSTPSSYIPTSGSTATRAAETLTAPSANLPWPTPQVIGDELVTNGTFDTDTDWTKGTGWAISGGTATKTAGVADDLSQIVSFSTNSVYKVDFSLTRTAGFFRVRFLNGSTVQSAAYSASGDYSIYLVAQSGNNVLGMYGDGSFAGSIDNISVKEINPLAVCIQMEGGATGDSFTTLRWYADANNYITQEIGASDLTFEQAASGTVDSVTGGSITSGINVPFNIASRHGSTFINGAVDGTALTEDTTPVALPDLSATDLEIGYDFMGTIKTIRVWANDLGDEGISEATT